MSDVSPPTAGASGPAPPPASAPPKTTIADQDQGSAQQATDQAKQKAGEVAGQAQEKAQEAAGQAKSRARDEIDRRSTDAGEQVSTTAQDLRSVGDTLREQGKDTPARIADQAADRAERLGGYLKESDADRILNDVEDFARRQPWVVVAGGLAVGFMAARFLKASSSERYQQRSANGQTSLNGSSGRPTGQIDAALPHEGVDAAGQRRFEPGQSAGSPGVTTPGGASGVDTPTSGVIPPGR
jgi:hypothetical protein